jgi:putative ABC transport system permease protein
VFFSKKAREIESFGKCGIFMFDLIIRNIMNRKTRSALTVCGIALGIFAVIVMGAMSENFHQTFERSMSVTSDKIRVFAESGVFGGGLEDDKVSDVLKVAGVKDAYGILMTTFDEDKSVTLYPVELKAGRFLTPGDSYHVIVGNNIKREYELQIGSKFKIHDTYFTVIGILDYTGSIFDNAVIVPLKTAQSLYNVGNSVSYIFAVPDEQVDTEMLSKRIELSVKGTSTLSPGELRVQARQSFMIFSVITISSGILAAIIGGLCVMNTMFMSVAERTREFGILKAIGAETQDILLLTLGEATCMGFFGGVLGILVGLGAVYAMNAWLVKTRIILFLITPRLLTIAMFFALLIGALSGLYPAYRASKMSPMEALKHA